MKIPKKFLLILIILPNTSFSKDYDSTLSYFGIGFLECKKIIELHDGKVDLLVNIWISGALTGYENSCRVQNGNCIGFNLNNLDEINAYVKKYCAENPNKRLGDAAEMAWLEFAHRAQ